MIFDICTLPKSHSRTIGAFTNDLLHRTTYIPIKLALFWVMLGSWPFESKQILIWPFQKGIVWLCSLVIYKVTSHQSWQLRPLVKRKDLRGAALAAAARPSWASANPAKQRFIAGLWGLVVWQPLGLQSHKYLYGKLLSIFVCSQLLTRILRVLKLFFSGWLSLNLLHNQGKGRFILSTAV